MKGDQPRRALRREIRELRRQLDAMRQAWLDAVLIYEEKSPDALRAGATPTTITSASSGDARVPNPRAEEIVTPASRRGWCSDA